jgi:hypothetical protein
VSPFDKAAGEQAPSKASTASIFLRGAKLGLDMFASLLMGAYTSMYFTDEEQIVAQIASIPLVPGRSVVSDEFCVMLQQELQQKPKEYWRHVESPYLQQIKVFCDNCRKRQVYEAKLRAEQGLGPNDPVNIPEPGVPTDYIVPSEELNNIKQEQTDGGGGGEDQGEDYYSKYFSGIQEGEDELKWVDSLVTDQEEIDKEKRQS